tara:strand:- start:362 stop:880 length:519 start_codon:yes stop_codon:yes gene_type:complete
MSGSLIKLQEVEASSSASITLGDSSWDTSYDVYMVKVNNFHTSADNVSLYVRFLVSGSPDTSSNYDYSQKTLRTLEVFGNEAQVNQDKINFGSIGNATGEFYNGIFYLFNFNNASEYSYGTKENIYTNSSGDNKSENGGFVLTETQANDGIQFTVDSGDFASGTFTLYGLKK